MTSYLSHERSYVPWKAGLSALGYIDTMLSKGAHYLEYGVSDLLLTSISGVTYGSKIDHGGTYRYILLPIVEESK